MSLVAVVLALACASPQSQAPGAPATPAAVAPAAASPEGIWQGYVESQQGRLFVRAVVIGGAAPSVRVSIPLAMAIDSNAIDVRVKDRAVGFTLKTRGVEGRFSGEVNERGDAFAGTLTLEAQGQQPDELPFTLNRAFDPKTIADHTTWQGALEVGASKVPLAITLAEINGSPIGSIDIPMQGLDGFPLFVTKTDGGGWSLLMPVGSETLFELAPKKSDDGKETLVGELKQGQVVLPLTLTKSDGAVTGMGRPQTPKAPFPYTAREVTIPHRFGHSLAGTLIVPERKDGKPERFPAVVMITGSGPQDRDETIFGHKPFLVIADALARAGIAVLRYDDRGVGGSTGNFAASTSFDFATDADEATEWLRLQPEIDPRRIGLIGHSEGGMIAPVVAHWQWEEGDPKDAVRFLVLMAGPGVSGREVLIQQMGRLLQVENGTKEEIDTILARQTAALDAVVARRPASELEPLVRAMVEEQLKFAAAHGSPQPPEAADAAMKQGMQQLTGGWMVEFLAHDPRPWIASLPIPILAMNGDLDVQVDATQNLPAIEAAAKAGNVPLTVKRYPTLNHLFQPAKTGGVDEYGTIETTIDPKALADLVDWVVTTANDPAILAIKPKARAEGGVPLEDKKPVAPAANNAASPVTLTPSPSQPK